MASSFQCHACGTEIEIIGGGYPGRHDDCPKCGNDLRCCLNCGNFDRARANECMEPVSERVSHKDRANFCDFFRPSGRAGGKLVKPSKDDLSRALAEKLRNLSK